ncbi:MAG: hypothetical protein KBC15_03905 [Candidatus Levybacteria bacterium]|nr:hypothetical protein [Candidatus Levybacteria bacterium]
MDDAAQQTINTQVPSQVTPPVAPPTQQAPVFHPQAVGGPKESVPFSSRTVEAPTAEYIRPTEVAPVIPQEVAEAGVEIAPDREQPQLDETHNAAGVTHSEPANIPHPTAPTGSVVLPYTFEQATQIEKTTSEDDSEHWLVLLSKYIMRKLSLKE